MRRGRWSVGIAVGVAVVTGGWAAVSWWHNGPPFGPDLLGARAVVSVETDDTAGPALARFGMFADAKQPGPLTFIAQFAAGTPPLAAPDLLVALALTGPDGQLYWAQRLLG